MEKENVETQTIKATDLTIMDKSTHKIPIKQKEKGTQKDPKEKAKGKESHSTATERLRGKTKRVNKTTRQSQ